MDGTALRATLALAALTLATASATATTSLGTGAPTQAPDEHAKLAPPKVATPAELAKSVGFAAEQLEPYKEILSSAERAALVRASQAVMASEAAGAIKRYAAFLAQDRQGGAEYKDVDDEVDIFTYAMPNDPMILLGTAKSYDGAVTAPPRLRRGAFEPVQLTPPGARPGAKSPKDVGDLVPPQAEAADAGAAEDEWMFQNPDQACTGSLSYSLAPNGSMYRDLELMPPPAGMDAHALNLLMGVEQNPNPLLKGGRDGGDEPGTAGEDEPARGDEATPGKDQVVSGIPLRVIPKDGPREIADAEGHEEADDDSGPLRLDGGKTQKFDEFVGSAKKSFHNEDTYIERLMAELQAARSSLTAIRQQCVEAGGVFREAGSDGKDATTLFGCTVKGQAYGLGAELEIEGGNYPLAVQVTYADPETGLTVTLRYGLDREQAELSARRGKDAFGPHLLWDTAGHPAALDFKFPEALQTTGLEYDVFEWHEDGAVKLVGHRRTGQSFGIERTWYASGALDGEVSFAADDTVASYKEWFENHRPAEDTRLVSGRIQGVRHWWHENGLPAGEVAYDKGEPDGPLSLWYDDGTKGVALTFKGGRLDGDVTWAYEDGAAMYQGRFKLDQPDGLHRVLLSGGNVLSERRFKDGQPEGAWVAYDTKGRPVREVGFRKGAKDGKSVMRYRDGQTFIEMDFKDGALDGPLNTYFPSGQLASTCLYEKDLLTHFTRYYPSGETAVEGQVQDGAKGTVSFTAMRKDGTPRIACTMESFETTGCHLYDGGGQEIPMPSEQTLAKSYKPATVARALPRTKDQEAAAAAGGDDDTTVQPATPLAWKPDACGGAKVHINYDQIINGQGETIVAMFDTKEECRDRTVGENLTCTLSLHGDKLKTGPCNVNGYDVENEGNSREVVDDVDGDQAAPLAH